MIFFIFLFGGLKKRCNFAASNGGTVAQLVEQRTENPRVTGSIPVGTTEGSRKAAFLVFTIVCFKVLSGNFSSFLADFTQKVDFMMVLFQYDNCRHDTFRIIRILL